MGWQYKGTHRLPRRLLRYFVILSRWLPTCSVIGRRSEIVGRYYRTTYCHLECHSGHTYALSFYPDGSQLVSGPRDGTVRLWDGAAGLHIATLKDHLEPVGAFKLSSSPDSSRLADHGGAIL